MARTRLGKIASRESIGETRKIANQTLEDLKQ